MQQTKCQIIRWLAALCKTISNWIQNAAVTRKFEPKLMQKEMWMGTRWIGLFRIWIRRLCEMESACIWVSVFLNRFCLILLPIHFDMRMHFSFLRNSFVHSFLSSSLSSTRHSSSPLLFSPYPILFSIYRIFRGIFSFPSSQNAFAFSSCKSFSVRFHFRFKNWVFHRIKNYQTTWDFGVVSIVPQSNDWNPMISTRMTKKKNPLKLKTDGAKSLTHIKFSWHFSFFCCLMQKIFSEGVVTM